MGDATGAELVEAAKPLDEERARRFIAAAWRYIDGGGTPQDIRKLHNAIAAAQNGTLVLPDRVVPEDIRRFLGHWPTR
ncbi:MAG: hypothetical protein Q7T01_03215 [bacterium]|nr:hypothetical protein [bacterium]